MLKNRKSINLWFTFQTITCHIVRLKLIERILDDYTVSGDTIDQRTLSLSVGKLVGYYFKCDPSTSYDDEEDENKTKGEARDLECEELVTLLLYLMQSYLWTTNGTFSVGFQYKLKDKKKVPVLKFKMVCGKFTQCYIG